MQEYDEVCNLVDKLESQETMVGDMWRDLKMGFRVISLSERNSFNKILNFLNTHIEYVNPDTLTHRSIYVPNYNELLMMLKKFDKLNKFIKKILSDPKVKFDDIRSLAEKEGIPVKANGKTEQYNWDMIDWGSMFIGVIVAGVGSVFIPGLNLVAQSAVMYATHKYGKPVGKRGFTVDNIKSFMKELVKRIDDLLKLDQNHYTPVDAKDFELKVKFVKTAVRRLKSIYGTVGMGFMELID